MSTTDNTGPVALSYLVAVHNSTQVIEATLKELGSHLVDRNAEIVVIENGSIDGTPALLERIAKDWAFDKVALRLITSQKGLGNAFRAGIAASRGETVVLTADDLPFGFDDLDAADKLDLAEYPMVIGSKAAGASVVERSLARSVLTWGFSTIRTLILGMRTRDPQGTYVVNGEWIRGVEPRLTNSGFLITTEICYLAERSGIRPLEVPVRLSPAHSAHGSRIRIKDVWLMAVGLMGIRRLHRAGAPVPVHT